MRSNLRSTVPSRSGACDGVQRYQRQLLNLQIRSLGRRIRMCKHSETRVSSCIRDFHQSHKVTSSPLTSKQRQQSESTSRQNDFCYDLHVDDIRHVKSRIVSPAMACKQRQQNESSSMGMGSYSDYRVPVFPYIKSLAVSPHLMNHKSEQNESTGRRINGCSGSRVSVTLHAKSSTVRPSLMNKKKQQNKSSSDVINGCTESQVRDILHVDSSRNSRFLMNSRRRVESDRKGFRGYYDPRVDGIPHVESRIVSPSLTNKSGQNNKSEGTKIKEFSNLRVNGIPYVNSPPSSTGGDCGFDKENRRGHSFTSKRFGKRSPSTATVSTRQCLDESMSFSRNTCDGSTTFGSTSITSEEKHRKNRGSWFRRRFMKPKNEWFLNPSPSQPVDTKWTMLMNFYNPVVQKLCDYKLVIYT